MWESVEKNRAAYGRGKKLNTTEEARTSRPAFVHGAEAVHYGWRLVSQAYSYLAKTAAR